METSIILKKCSDIRCFHESHRQCPKCFGIIHVNVIPIEQSINVELSKCLSITCFENKHLYCPDCYCILHISIINKI